MLACFSFHAPLLSLFTARDAVGAREVGGAQMEEDGKVDGGVATPKCEVCVVEFVTAFVSTRDSYGRLDTMRNPVRSRHESSKAPRPHRSELPGAANSGL